MNIIIKVGKDRDDLTYEEMSIDGKEVLYVHSLSDCPEDAIIGRDLVSCRDVALFMQQAYNVGVKGEQLVIDVKNI